MNGACSVDFYNTFNTLNGFYQLVCLSGAMIDREGSGKVAGSSCAWAGLKNPVHAQACA